jgi:hypothetical protein
MDEIVVALKEIATAAAVLAEAWTASPGQGGS